MFAAACRKEERGREEGEMKRGYWTLVRDSTTSEIGTKNIVRRRDKKAMDCYCLGVSMEKLWEKIEKRLSGSSWDPHCLSPLLPKRLSWSGNGEGGFGARHMWPHTQMIPPPPSLHKIHINLRRRFRFPSDQTRKRKKGRFLPYFFGCRSVAVAASDICQFCHFLPPLLHPLLQHTNGKMQGRGKRGRA